MADLINPKNFSDSGALVDADLFPVHQTGGWFRATLLKVKQYLDNYFAASMVGTTNGLEYVRKNGAWTQLKFEDTTTPGTYYRIVSVTTYTDPDTGQIYVNANWEITT